MDNVAEAPTNQQVNAPYAERWELLRNVMARLYMDEKKKIKEIVEIMKSNYQFYASENQYKRQFGLWGMKRALPTKKKEKISKILETRAKQGKSSLVLHNGKVEVRKIRRYMKEQSRQSLSTWTNFGNTVVDIENLSGHALQCGNRVFMNWSMPSAILRSAKYNVAESASPSNSASTPMSGIVVTTPSSNAGPSPRSLPSPGTIVATNNGKSAITIAAQENLRIHRAHLFIQKRHKDLFRGMSMQEQCTVTDWMHQFWKFSFTAAKTWGSQLQIEHLPSLRFNQPVEETVGEAHRSPSINADSPEQNPYSHSSRRPENGFSIQQPSALCHWSIHYREIYYERVRSPPDDNPQIRPDPRAISIHGFVEHLQRSLERNEFSSIGVTELPISSGQIARAAKRSPEQMLEEAFGFSIMARNVRLVAEMLEMIELDNFTLRDLHPLHLASSYLDGSKTCCNLFSDLVMSLSTGETSVRKLYTNHLNHTVLDNLMIAVLKGHTSCTPGMVDDAFRKESRFAGEEVDICGRWDADSECIRQLQANGNPTIPRSWKHMFCHTAVQTITHCIGTLFSAHWGPDINTPSGLYLRRCPNETCGLKLQLMPLHTLVVTAVYLAQLGFDGENLFGMVACLLSLLSKGANPLLKAHISPMILLSNEDNQGCECSHSELDPLELANKVPENLISTWSQECVIGWKIFCGILRLSQSEWNIAQAPRRPTSRALNDEHESIYDMYVQDIHYGNEIIDLEAMDVDWQPDKDNDEGSDSSNDEESDASSDKDRDYGKGLPAHCSEHDGYNFQQNFFGRNRKLATLWAAVQTELLTYRRIRDGDPWISTNFDMKSVLESLEHGRVLSIGLVSKNMMQPFCRCGVFYGAIDPICVCVEEACRYYFSNLEDWSRSNFIYAPDDRWDFD